MRQGLLDEAVALQRLLAQQFLGLFEDVRGAEAELFGQFLERSRAFDALIRASDAIDTKYGTNTLEELINNFREGSYRFY